MEGDHKISKKKFESIIHDTELTPFFIDYLAENLKMSLSTFYKLASKDDLRFKTGASKSLTALIKKLEAKVEEKELYPTIETVSKYYAESVYLNLGNLKID